MNQHYVKYSSKISNLQCTASEFHTTNNSAVLARCSQSVVFSWKPLKAQNWNDHLDALNTHSSDNNNKSKQRAEGSLFKRWIENESKGAADWRRGWGWQGQGRRRRTQHPTEQLHPQTHKPSLYTNRDWRLHSRGSPVSKCVHSFIPFLPPLGLFLMLLHHSISSREGAEVQMTWKARLQMSTGTPDEIRWTSCTPNRIKATKLQCLVCFCLCLFKHSVPSGWTQQAEGLLICCRRHNSLLMVDFSPSQSALQPQVVVSGECVLFPNCWKGKLVLLVLKLG